MSKIVDRLLPFRRYCLERNIDLKTIPPLVFSLDEMMELADEAGSYQYMDKWSIWPGAKANVCGFEGRIVAIPPE